MSTLPLTSQTGYASRTARIESIDLLRGIVMVIMALDHVRDYFHSSAFLYNPTDLNHTSPAIFFTRWITHFCAPVFVFLAGTSARLQAEKKNKRELSFFLFSRGLWLIFLEIVLINFGWSFNPQYQLFILQVIWAIGVAMIVLSVMIHLPGRIILVVSILLIAGHNVLDGVQVHGGKLAAFGWALLHKQAYFTVGHRGILVGYPILPWIGIMGAGYCLGSLYSSNFDPVKRKRNLVILGWGFILAFFLLRAINIYGDPSPWSIQKNSLFSLLSFMNTTKYPPSLLYVLMTLGPGILFLAYMEKPMGSFSRKIALFGRVPFFYYLVHIFWIHLLAVIGAVILGFHWSDMVLSNWVSGSSQLRGYGFNLLTVYLIWIAVTISLYPLCKWYDRYKRDHRSYWWLGYF